MLKNIVVIGSSGSIGKAFVNLLSLNNSDAKIYAFSRNKVDFNLPNVISGYIDYNSEESISTAAKFCLNTGSIDLVIVATGFLHSENIKPEKSLKDLSYSDFQEVLTANTVLPAIIAKHFIPLLSKDIKSIFSVLSARVGSISDNRLGGWYSYRASKAALNMFVKTVSIESLRNNKNSIIVGLHPGTVDSKLSEPFQANIRQGKLFTPEYSVEKLYDVLNKLTVKDSGKCFAWDGKEILP